MASREVELYEKAVQRAIDRWWKKLEEPLKKIEKLDKEIKRLEETKKSGPLSEDEEELLQKCIKAQEKLQKEVENAGLELKVDLMLLESPPKADKSEFDKLSDRLSKYIKLFEKGVPLAGGFTLKPDIEFDFKKLTIKKAMVKLEWKF